MTAENVVYRRPDRKDLGAHLQAIREDAQLTREELADEIGIKPASIAKIERGAARTQSPTVERWLLACGVDEPSRDWWAPYGHLLADAASNAARAAHSLREPVPEDPMDWPAFEARAAEKAREEIQDLIERNRRQQARNRARYDRMLARRAGR